MNNYGIITERLDKLDFHDIENAMEETQFDSDMPSLKDICEEKNSKKNDIGSNVDSAQFESNDIAKWDERFNGTYETSYYAEHTLEQDLLDAGRGVLAYEGPNGELIVERDDRIDVWGEGDGEGHYPHYYYNGPDDYGEAPEDRHDND